MEALGSRTGPHTVHRVAVLRGHNVVRGGHISEAVHTAHRAAGEPVVEEPLVGEDVAHIVGTSDWEGLAVEAEAGEEEVGPVLAP